MRIKKNQRGFRFGKFKDAYGQECSIQDSSLVTPHIWLGVVSTGPHLKGPMGSTNEYVSTRMHLNKKQVKELIKIMQRFVDTETIAP